MALGPRAPNRTNAKRRLRCGEVSLLERTPCARCPTRAAHGCLRVLVEVDSEGGASIATASTIIRSALAERLTALTGLAGSASPGAARRPVPHSSTRRGPDRSGLSWHHSSSWRLSSSPQPLTQNEPGAFRVRVNGGHDRPVRRGATYRMSGPGASRLRRASVLQPDEDGVARRGGDVWPECRWAGIQPAFRL